MAPITTKGYNNWLKTLKATIHQSKFHTALQVNSNMLMMYWLIGKELNEKIEKENWGAKVIDTLSIDLQKEFPDMQGFSVRSLTYMKDFATKYDNGLILQQPVAELKKTKKSLILQQPVAELKKTRKSPILQQPVAELGSQKYVVENNTIFSIPWGHHTLILDKVKIKTAAIWYIEQTIENNWSRAILKYQIETDLYTRQVKKKKTTNFLTTLPKAHGDLANQILKDPYKFNFLQLSAKANDHELETQLMNHIQKFLIELGAGFAFVGRQVKIKAGKKEYFIDLLFYHLQLRSYIVIDLKMDEFMLEHTGKMNGYLNMVNKNFRTAHDNPSIGIILCGSKDDVEVDFALTNIAHPIGVSEYEFTKALPAKIANKMPGAKQLKLEMKKFFKQKNTSGK
jgi:predicted nuclease of restriction endonuclease-like (RecB) superfamily